MRARTHVLLAGAAALLLAVALHASAIAGAFLSDDYSVVGDIHAWVATDGSALRGALVRFFEPLSAHSNYYRPLGMLSFALDYTWAAATPLPWHATNLLLHLLNGALVGALVLRLMAGLPRVLPAATLAAALFWLTPFAPEVSVWISGRYDGLATAFMLLALLAHLRAGGFDRWRVLSLIAFALALAAKEAAMLLPAYLLLASAFDPRQPQPPLVSRAWRTLLACAPALVLFLAYLGWRVHLFGHALQVYPDTPPLSSLFGFALFDRIGTLLAILPDALPGIPAAALMALLAFLLAMLGVGAAFAGPVLRRLHLLCALATGLSVAALLPHLGPAGGHGEGGRLLYLAAAWLAAWCGLALVALPARAGLACGALLLAASAALQAPLLRQWAVAGDAMDGVLAAIGDHAPRDDGSLGLLLLPDHYGPVPFARNAQGALVAPPMQLRVLLSEVVPLVPTQFGEWRRHVAEGLPARLKGLPAGTPVALRMLCYDAGARRLVDLGPTDAGDDWPIQWRTAVAASTCAPFFRAAGWLPAQ